MGIIYISVFVTIANYFVMNKQVSIKKETLQSVLEPCNRCSLVFFPLKPKIKLYMVYLSEVTHK